MRRFIVWSTAGVLGVAGLLFGASAFRVQIAAALVKPKISFGAHPPPEAPDYKKNESWAALPDRVDGADRVPDGERDEQATALADAFFVHPTTYFDDDRWNQPLDDADANDITDRRVLPNQASAFNGCCRVYAPRYRQATLYSFMSPASDGRSARDLAYSDVERAFHAFLERIGPDRPIVLAAHSQGAHHLLRLLEREVAPTALRERLVVAYLVGMPIPSDKLARRLSNMSVCTSPTDTRCFVSWNTIGADADRSRFYEPTLVRYESGWESNQGKSLVCVNPLTFRADETQAPSSLNLGAVVMPADGERARLDAAVTGAQCSGGLLTITASVPGRYRRILVAADDYHVYDYNLFYENVRQNAKERVRAFLASRQATVH